MWRRWGEGWDGARLQDQGVSAVLRLRPELERLRLRVQGGQVVGTRSGYRQS